MTASFAGLIVLLVALAASCVLGAGTTWLVVRRAKRPVLWVLAPVFVLAWVAVGVGTVAGLVVVVDRIVGRQ